LDHTESAKEGAQVGLGRGHTTDKERAAEDLDVALANRVVPFDELGTGRWEVGVLALGRRRAAATTAGGAALAVLGGTTPTTSTGITRITSSAGGITTVVFAIHGAVATAGWGCGTATVPTRRARAAAISSWRARIVTVTIAITVVTVLGIVLTPTTRGCGGLPGHHRESGEGSSRVGSAHRVRHVEELEGGRPLVLRDALGRQELQQLKLLRQRIAIGHGWSGVRLGHHGGQRVRACGHGVGSVVLAMRLSRHGWVLDYTRQSSIRVRTHCSGSVRVRSRGNRGGVGG
jgi:hypothetical protein